MMNKTNYPKHLKQVLAGLTLCSMGFMVNAGELHDAAQQGDLATVSRILAAGVDIESTDGEGQTALYVAAKYGQTEIVKFLISKRADLTHTAMGPFGSLGTPLHAAVGRGKHETAKTLLENGANANQPDTGSGPPLHVALQRQDLKTAKLLRAFGAAPVSAEPIDHLIANANIELGKQVGGTCSVCHNLTPEPSTRNRPGPTLWNVVGRPRAIISDYPYSTSMQQKHGIWSYADLNSLVSNPRAFIPGTKMSNLSGIKSIERRAALIAYLRILADKPFPLP